MIPLSRRTALQALGTLAGLGPLSTLGKAESSETKVWRTVTEGYDGQTGKARIRTDPETLAALGVRTGEVVAVGRTRGGKGVPARVWRSDHSEWGQGEVRVGRYVRRATGVPPGKQVRLQPVSPKPAERIVLTQNFGSLRLDGKKISKENFSGLVHASVVGRPIIKGTKLPLRVSEGRKNILEPYILETEPRGHVRVTRETELVLQE